MQGSSGLVGARVKRVEDPRFLRGRGNFVSGMKVPGMLEMALVRSPHAHARIVAVDTTKAQAVPGVVAVFTGADLKDRIRPLRVELDLEKNPNYKACDWYPLAWDKVQYVGDGVALVVASDRYTAEDGAEQVEVEYELLTPIVDPDRALADTSNLVHEEWGDNVLNHTDFSAGDPDGAFARAATIVEARFRTGRHHALPLEPRAYLASFDGITEKLTLWSSTQMPHMVRTKLAEHLDFPENQIRVIAPDVGGGFGLKCHIFAEETLVVVASMELGRPVRWLEDRAESLTSSFHAKEEVVDAALALDADGRILGARVRAVADVGAYSASPWSSAFEVLHTAQMFPGPYRLQDYAFQATSVSTNKSTLSVYRGVGAPIATFTMEGLLDLAAQKTGIDPVEIRRRNMITRDEFPYTSVTGMVYEIGSYIESLEKAAEISAYGDFRREQAELRKKGVYRGIGFSCYNEITALGSAYWYSIGVPMSAYESANIKMDPSGRLTVFLGTHSQGQAHETVFAQIAADELGLPMDRIRIRLGDTDETPYGWGAWGSRAAVSAGGAVIFASRKLAEKLRRLAGHFLEVAADDIELRDGVARVKGVPGRQIEIAELANRALVTAAAEIADTQELGLDTTYYYEPPPATFPNATHVAIVDVDIETGMIKIVRYVVVEDCGRMINPMVVDGQVAGGVAQGLGGALYEHLVYDENGQLLTTSLMDYLVPSSCEVPLMEIAHIETPSPLVPGGFKGAGEGGAVAPMGALANAVSDALAPFGARACELPLAPERVFRLTHDAGTQNATES